MAIRRIDQSDDEVDPLSGVANLFDLGIVFALGLMLAAGGHLVVSQPAGSENSGFEAPEAKMERLPRFRMSDDSLSGRGERLGIAYRLANGEVVYVPEGETAEVD